MDSDWVGVLDGEGLVEWGRPGTVLGRNLGLMGEVGISSDRAWVKLHIYSLLPLQL